jgi:hypothetical protein
MKIIISKLILLKIRVKTVKFQIYEWQRTPHCICELVLMVGKGKNMYSDPLEMIIERLEALDA